MIFFPFFIYFYLFFFPKSLFLGIWLKQKVGLFIQHFSHPSGAVRSNCLMQPPFKHDSGGFEIKNVEEMWRETKLISWH